MTGLFDGLSRGRRSPSSARRRTNAAAVARRRAGSARGISTVDDVDTPSGKLALALLLGGAPSGSFGVKDTAEAALPRIEPAP